MKRKIYLEGELGQKFIPEFTADVSSVRDAMRLIQANFPSFNEYVIDCHEKNVGFVIDIAHESIQNEQDLILPLKEGDITITAVPAGSKSGGAKILTAIAIMGLMFIPGGAALIGAYGAGSMSIAGYAAGAASLGISAGIAGTVLLAASSIGINLALTGIQQLMAPDPAVDEQSPQSYLFNGSQQNTLEGDPVPVLYGELRVPGRPISFGIVNNARTYYSLTANTTGTPPPSYNNTEADNPGDYEQDITPFINTANQNNDIEIQPTIGTAIEAQ